MTISLNFFPQMERARQVDRRMRDELARSLSYILGELGVQLGELHPELDRLLEELHGGAVYPPSTFGLYYELTSALMEADKSISDELVAQLAQESAVADRGVTVLALDHVRPESTRARYQRLMDTDPQTPFHIVSPPADSVDLAIGRFRSGMNRLRQMLPELADEFEVLVREVILVVGADDLNYGFAGGSCYMLWGALFINATAHDSDVATIEAIAHESAHSLLFGLTVDEPLVLNDDQELFSSPLRDDPRPMDGIYHATYVSARMHWAMSQLLVRGALAPQEVELARSHCEANRRSFWVGYATVERAARLSESGRLLLVGAHTYMSAFPAD